jgi:3-hydroxyisobutyrate dehydrogenase-like beta-hydroxyacid dehydrogenase
LFQRSEPMLEIMGKARFFLGDVGKGAEMKLIVNMVRTPLDAILVRFVVEAQVTHFHLVEVDRVRDWYLYF